MLMQCVMMLTMEGDLCNKTDVNQSLEHTFAGFFFVPDIGFQVRHQDAVSTVKLNVRPSKNQHKKKLLNEQKKRLDKLDKHE